MLPIAFSPTDPRSNGNEIWDKMGCKSSCVKDFCEIFAHIGGFSGMGHRVLLTALSPTDPCCHGNEIWDEMSYNSAFVRDFCEIFAPVGGFSEIGHRMLPISFFPDRHLKLNCLIFLRI